MTLKTSHYVLILRHPIYILFSSRKWQISLSDFFFDIDTPLGGGSSAADADS